ncbi:flagellar assembly protein FliH [Lentibacillus sp. N15]|uniref:flagellar assembly protein FliH n=1 Tax=Lentibacillus songyuanensis TaxID=3136161 RepID=UPI0031BB5A4F
MFDTNVQHQHHSLQKQIKLKPIAEFKQRKEREQKETIGDHHLDLQQQIQVAQQELEQLMQRKEQAITSTQEAIAEEKAEWEKTREAYIKQAQEEGYRNGFATGKQESITKYQQLLDQANQIIDAATADYHAKLDQSEDAIIDLAIHTSEKIIQQQLAEQPQTFLSIVQAAMKEIKDQSPITIYVHPDQYPVVLQQKEELSRLLHGNTELMIHVDEEAALYSCVIEHPLGKIDAGIDTQLQQLRDILHDLTQERES